jgi:hypothetical protein
MDSILIGWAISILVVIYMVLKFWKKILKTLLIILVVSFIVAVAKVKGVYDSFVDSPQKQELLIDTITNKVLK